MDIKNFISILKENNIEYFTGVPDSLLSPLCDFLISNYGCQSDRHVIAHNEGGCVGLAAGYHLATGKIPCVYLQNSGIGNITNPAVSLIHKKVYAIPMLFIVGWRGRPGTSDEPQHVYQGEISKEQLESMGIYTNILTKDTTEDELISWFAEFEKLFNKGESAAILVDKGALASDTKTEYQNDFTIIRENAIKIIAESAGQDIVVSTTGKISRELFEYREEKNQGHKQDFLTVGSMGHSSMIAMGIAAQHPDKKVWCIDGDGAVIMHMGAMSTIGNHKPRNLIHIVLNNTAHESVGGAPTCAITSNFVEVANGSGYNHSYHVENIDELAKTLNLAKKEEGPIFIEVCVSLGSRADLGRPTTTPIENKESFMNFIGGN